MVMFKAQPADASEYHKADQKDGQSDGAYKPPIEYQQDPSNDVESATDAYAKQPMAYSSQEDYKSSQIEPSPYEGKHDGDDDPLPQPKPQAEDTPEYSAARITKEDTKPGPKEAENALKGSEHESEQPYQSTAASYPAPDVNNNNTPEGGPQNYPEPNDVIPEGKPNSNVSDYKEGTGQEQDAIEYAGNAAQDDYEDVKAKEEQHYGDYGRKVVPEGMDVAPNKPKLDRQHPCMKHLNDRQIAYRIKCLG